MHHTQHSFSDFQDAKWSECQCELTALSLLILFPPQCSYGFIYDGNQLKVTCFQCHNSFCAQCKKNVSIVTFLSAGLASFQTVQFVVVSISGDWALQLSQSPLVGLRPSETEQLENREGHRQGQDPVEPGSGCNYGLLCCRLTPPIIFSILSTRGGQTDFLCTVAPRWHYSSVQCSSAVLPWTCRSEAAADW